MKNLSIGVIGHVDHGKTSLVKALTGIDTDLLREEHERGLSIVPGFSYINHKNISVDLIDLPGHEAFVKNMVSGASGMSSVLLVIAANEGIMPQTIEHLDITSILKIEKGLVVLSKVDLLSDKELLIERKKIEKFLEASHLKNIEIHEVSAVTKIGIDNLRKSIIDIAKNIPENIRVKKNFFLPIDRSFHKQGFGTIVTGTLRLGSIDTESKISLLPQNRKLSIRGIHVHGKNISEAKKGQRIAINLRGIKADEVDRGNVISSKDFLTKTTMIETEVKLLDQPLFSLKNNTIVHFLIGTLDIPARIKIKEKNILNNGEKALAKFFFKKPVVTHKDEKFIIRSFSPSRTIGGGKVIRVNVSKRDIKAIEAPKKLTLPKVDFLKIDLDQAQTKIINDLEKKYLDLGHNVESQENILDGKETTKEMNSLLLKQGKLVSLKQYDRHDKCLVHTKNLDIFKSKIKESFPYPSKFTIAQVRDLLATSRKSVIPIMEHFDNTGVTQRFGDFRRLRVK